MSLEELRERMFITKLKGCIGCPFAEDFSPRLRTVFCTHPLIRKRVKTVRECDLCIMYWRRPKGWHWTNRKLRNELTDAFEEWFEKAEKEIFEK